MTDLRDAAQKALEALESTQLFAAHEHYPRRRVADAITALRAALEQPERAQAMRDAGYTRRPTLREMADPEQPEQEPLAWLESPYGSIRMNATMRFQFPPQSLKWKIPLYLHPPRREWRGLTDTERAEVQYESFKRGLSPLEFMELHEAKLKERNA